MFRHYIADTFSVLVNITSKLGGGSGNYPQFTELLEKAYKPKNKTDYMDGSQIIAYICDKLDNAGDAREVMKG